MFGKIIKNLISIPSEGGKWHIELNIIDWGKGNQFDLRRWSEDGTKMSKGFTLTKYEVQTIFKDIKEEDLQ